MEFNFENKRSDFVENEINTLVHLEFKKAKGELTKEEERLLKRRMARYDMYKEEIEEKLEGLINQTSKK